MRALGLWGAQTGFKLPARLPRLPASLKTAADVEAQAIQRRVDLQAMRHDLAALATSLGLTQATRFVSDVDLTGARIKTRVDDASGERDVTKAKKLALEIEIPIFDFGAAATAEAEERYMRAANLLADKAVKARSEAREAYLAYRGTWEIARHFERSVLPLRDTIQQESLLHYNGMLTDVTALIADVKARVAARLQAVDARRDFWIAENELRAALAGGGSGVSVAGAGGAPAADAPAAH